MRRSVVSLWCFTSLFAVTEVLAQGQPGPSPQPAPTYTPAPVTTVTPPQYQPAPGNGPQTPAGPPQPQQYPQQPQQYPQQYAQPQPQSAPPAQYPAAQPQPATPQYAGAPYQTQPYPAQQSAQPQYPPPAQQGQMPPPQSGPEQPPATTGSARRDFMFKGALRLGAVIPLGNLVDSPQGAMSDNVSNQTLVTFDVGLRYRAWVFGIFLGIGGGSAQGAGADAFQQQGFSNPSTVIFQIGPEVHYNVYDEGSVRPWIGLGLGLDALIVGASQGDLRYTESYATFAPFRPMIGVDFLISKGFGLGLYVDWQIAKYGTVHTSLTPKDDPTTSIDESVANAVNTDIEIQNPAYHQWLGLGLRAILFP